VREMSLEACIFQVRDSQGIIRGTGFAVSPNLVVTCAHVVKDCKAKVSELLSLFFYPERIELKAEVLSDGWDLEEDVAFLRLHSSLPLNAMHMGEKLGSFGSKNEIKRSFRAFGYPNLKSDVKGFWAQGLIKGKIQNDHGAFRLQLGSQEITFGMSGAPVIDDESGCIVGMVQKTQIPDATGRFRDLAYALPIEVLCKLRPDELIVKEISDRLSYYINMAPDPENNYIRRETEYEQLVEGLLNNQNDTAATISITLCGAGGYGKTTLAKAVCHDPEVVKKFSDGILWITLGEKPKNLIGHIQDLIYRLSDKRPEFEGLDAAVSDFKDLLNEKCILLVIDDVWYSSHLEPFIQGGTKCVRLITTRINDILPAGTLEVRVDTMKNEEAARILLSDLSCALSWAEDQKINKLAKRLGYWPQLLKMANSALKQLVERDKSFGEALDHVNHKLDKKKLTAFDSKDHQKRNQAVEATISVSFDLLDENEVERYEELAIFPEDEEIHLKTVEKLWGKTADYDDFDVEDLCYKLSNLSLLQTYDENKKTIKLHDVMREYLIIKSGGKTSLLHSQFLEAFNVETWANLPEEETYLWKNLSYHLVGTERKDELRELLLDFDWIQSKLSATDVHFLINDYYFFHEDYPVEMVKCAIQLSANALSKDKKLLDGQLLGRLELFSETEIRSLLGYIREHKGGIRILPLTGSLTPPGGPLLRTLEGHSGRVTAVSITLDGNYAVSASEDTTLKVWDLNEGKEVHTLRGHFNPINAFSITSDGNYAVSASKDSILKVWDLKTGKEIDILKGHFGNITAISITPDGKYVVSASRDRTIKVWDIKTGKEVHTLTGHSRTVNAISITSDGKYVVSGSKDNTLKVWDIKTGKEIHALTGHSNAVVMVSIIPDGNYAISVSEDSTLKVWDIKTGKEVHTLTGHSHTVNAVSFTPDGNYAISASSDNTLKVWDIKTGKEIHALTGHSNAVLAVSITHDGSYAVSASSDNTLKIWDLKEGKEVHTLTGHSNAVLAVSITHDGSYAVSASEDSTLKVWNLKTGKEVHTLTGHSSGVRAVSVTPDGNCAVSASEDSTLIVWELKTRKEIHTLKGHSRTVNSFSITPNGDYAVSASEDRTLKVWDLKEGKEVHTLTGHSNAVLAVSLTPDGNCAVSASKDSTLKVWNLKTGKEVHTLTGHSSEVRAVSVTPDGNYAVSASEDSTLKVWDLKAGEEVHTLKGHFSLVTAVSIIPYSNYAVSVSEDRILIVWDLKTGKEIRARTGHSHYVTAVSVTPDGNYAVSASEDSTLIVWDLRTGNETHILKGHSNAVLAVSLTPDGSCAVSASKDSTLKVWNLKTGKQISAFRGESPFRSVVFSPDGTIIVAGEESGRIHFLLFDRRSEN
jgi:WD40 repeat protein